MDIKYQIFDPSGNITALVEGDMFTPEERKIINDAIMAAHAEVEQVGFVSEDAPAMTMAGGEFCGNATRSAIMHYLQRMRDKAAGGRIKGLTDAVLSIKTCGQKINGGAAFMPAEQACETEVKCRISMAEISASGLVPSYHVQRLDTVTTRVDIPGISFLIKAPSVLASLREKKADLKAAAMRFLKDSGMDNDALGVIFMTPGKAETSADGIARTIAITPAIWVKAVDTLFLENACGSGSIASALAAASLAGSEKADPADQNRVLPFTIMQPSGKPLHITLEYEGTVVRSVLFSGPIATDGVVRTIRI